MGAFLKKFTGGYSFFFFCLRGFVFGDGNEERRAVCISFIAEIEFIFLCFTEI